MEAGKWREGRPAAEECGRALDARSYAPRTDDVALLSALLVAAWRPAVVLREGYHTRPHSGTTADSASNEHTLPVTCFGPGRGRARASHLLSVVRTLGRRLHGR